MFAKLGANVVVNDVSQQGADSVVKEVEAGMLTFLTVILCTGGI
jgi:hypothetical protein